MRKSHVRVGIVDYDAYEEQWREVEERTREGKGKGDEGGEEWEGEGREVREGVIVG